MVEMKSTWLGCDDQLPQPTRVSFEQRQMDWMTTHYPRLWQALKQLETQPINVANVTEGRHDKGTGT